MWRWHLVGYGLRPNPSVMRYELRGIDKAKGMTTLKYYCRCGFEGELNLPKPALECCNDEPSVTYEVCSCEFCGNGFTITIFTDMSETIYEPDNSFALLSHPENARADVFLENDNYSYRTLQSNILSKSDLEQLALIEKDNISYVPMSNAERGSPANELPAKLAKNKEVGNYSGLKFYGTAIAIFVGAIFFKDFIDPRKFIAIGFLIWMCYGIYVLARAETLIGTVKNLATGIKWVAIGVFAMLIIGSIFNCSGNNSFGPAPEDIYFRK